jgi:hypothetical protein
MEAEKFRPATEVYRVTVPDDAAFDASAANERGLVKWTANPSRSSTQCSIAASRALQAGGVALNTITTGTLMPGFFANGLQSLPELFDLSSDDSRRGSDHEDNCGAIYACIRSCFIVGLGYASLRESCSRESVAGVYFLLCNLPLVSLDGEYR